MFSPGEYAISSSSGIMLPKGFHTSMPQRLIGGLKRYRAVDMDSWAIHHLRKTARTNFSTLTEPHIAEIMLGLALPGRMAEVRHAQVSGRAS